MISYEMLCISGDKKGGIHNAYVFGSFLCVKGLHKKFNNSCTMLFMFSMIVHCNLDISQSKGVDYICM